MRLLQAEATQTQPWLQIKMEYMQDQRKQEVWLSSANNNFTLRKSI